MTVEVFDGEDAIILMRASRIPVDKFKPIPPNESCTGFLEVAGLFIVFDNNLGKVTAHVLLGANRQEARAYYNKIAPVQVNPRLIFCGKQESSPINN